MKHIGVTGTREPVDDGRVAGLGLYLEKVEAEHGDVYLHTGCCTGWDEVAFFAALDLGWQVVCHPPHNTSQMSPLLQERRELGWYSEQVSWMEPLVYSARNFNIVAESDEMITAPLHPEHHPNSRRSGTWQTIRMALDKDKPVWQSESGTGRLLKYVRGRPNPWSSE